MPAESQPPRRTVLYVPVQGTKHRKKQSSVTIAYRIDESTAAWLLERASPYRLSIHELARQKLMETIAGKDLDAIRAEVAEVRKEIMQLREDLAVSTEALLTEISKAPRERIRAWIDENIRHT